MNQLEIQSRLARIHQILKMKLLQMDLRLQIVYAFNTVNCGSMYNNQIVNLARGVAYVDGRTGEGRSQAAGADGRQAPTGCGWG